MAKVLKRNVSDFMKLLQKSARRHNQGWYHYTVMSSLMKMKSTSTALFSLISKSNDASEFDANRHYMMSFSFGSAESIAMWGIYGIPRKEAVRLKFSQTTISRWIENMKESRLEVYGVVPGRRLVDLSIHPLKVIVSDVAYYGKNAIVQHKDKKYLVRDESKVDVSYNDSPLAPYIKKWPWSYEQEVRVVVEFEEPVLDSKGEPYEKIAVDFLEPLDELFSKEGEVMLGPWCKRSPSTVRNNGLSCANVVSSEFTGLLRLRTACDICKKVKKSNSKN